MMDSWGCVLLTAVAGIAFVVSSETDVNKCEEFYQANGPRISPCKSEIILQKGQNFTLKCQANTVIEFTQQEVPEENIGNFSIKNRNLTDENAEYKYEISLDLINVDRYAIGYYACKDGSVDKDVLNSLTEEPSNTENVSYIYVYVNGTDSLFAPMREVVTGKSEYYVVECRPSTPDVAVKLLVASQNKTPDNVKFLPKIGFLMKTCSKVAYKCRGHRDGKLYEEKQIRRQKEQPQPIVFGGIHEFLENETFSLNCTVNYTHNSALNLTWKYPNDNIKGTIIEEGNNDVISDGVLYRNITIVNATKQHAGVYTCFSKNTCGEKQHSFSKKFLDKPYLKLVKYGDKRIIESTQKLLSFTVGIKSYPPANHTFYKNGIELKTSNETYDMKWKDFSQEACLKVTMKTVEQSDNYTLFVTNGILNDSVTYDLRFKTEPTVNMIDKICEYDTKISLECEVTGYPLPNVEWIFSSNGKVNKMESARVYPLSIYKERAVLDAMCHYAGNITCQANNTIGQRNITRKLLVYEITNGFGIQTKIDENDQKKAWFAENQNTSIKCLASKYNFTNVTWSKDGSDDLGGMVEYSDNEFSHVARLKINGISLYHSGTYTCRGFRDDGTEVTDTIFINVAALRLPVIIVSNNIKEELHKYLPVQLDCLAQGVPRPTIQWVKDEEVITRNDSQVYKINSVVNRTTVNSSLFIKQLEEEDIGRYECVAVNDVGVEKQAAATLMFKDIPLFPTEAAYTKYLIVIAIIVFVFIILVIYLTCKIKKEKQFRKELAAAGLLYFKDGVTKSLNPDLGIDEQAELLPYDEKFEFPSDKLVLGKQLGAGAFGVVYKADARGIVNAEETTPVAVKMVKKTADNMYIKALASELKIMVHLGKHINIVNLLGACTKNVGKRELVVIVEYCKFGNIHNYMQRHREVFIDQLSDSNKEKSFGKVNRGYDSTGSTGVQSDYGTANTQDTDHTLLTNNTSRTCRKNAPTQPPEVVKVSEGYVQPEWRSNYESDYSYDGRSPRPLTSRDLLAWAFQIARGMEYLASRKVLHGDLAARNILLADDNIVKICDFGLAKSIYKNDEYKKKENSPLPVKWLAIECMTDRIFSTQSDVWSFGIVLWEMFSLAKTPYPNISPAHLLQFLSEGHRLDKPAYSDDRIYSLMKRCWEQKPTARPSFTQLQEILGTFLEDNVRNHYVDLNSSYMELNSKPEGQEDYLEMMCAPDYNNLVTPSPHHYVNELNDARSFFPPTPTKVDEEGYLQMSPASNTDIFSPKPSGPKFDFDPRKFNARPSVASSGGSELTPMLTLNNLPRSGSDSDHEGNASPYLNVCPKIEEETDEVFETKQYNVKNAQNSAVSNPTYITFDIDVEKKPIDIHNYSNIVPNGLVK